MNEKIRQLAENAGQGTPYHIPPEFVNKFAELIVEECMQIIKVDMYEDAISNMWSKNKLQMNKEHFGVEE